MALTRIPGGIWAPTFPFGSGGISGNSPFAPSDSLLMDADQEEVQIIGRVVLAGGTGSKTFGTSSKVGWLPGASITFGAVATLRVGIKKSATIDDANGPPGRATIGAAAFDVYTDLVGGVTTITSNTWRDDAMATLLSGTVTVNNGDRVAVSFLLSLTSGTQSIKVRGSTAGATLFPEALLVTTGPTYTAQAVFPNIILTFDDGSIGWIDPEFVFDGNPPATTAIGNGVIYGNIMRLPFDCAVDAVMFIPITAAAGAASFDVGFWQTPLATPAAMTNGTVSVVPKNLPSSAARSVMVPLPAEITLSKNTDYALGVKQNSATNVSIQTWDVSNVAHWQANGLDSGTYAATSTAGAAFSQLNSGKRRMAAFARISSIDVTAAGGSGIAHMAGDGGGFAG